MGLLNRLAAALGKNLTVEFATGSAPSAGPSPLTDQAPREDTVGRFVYRMNRLRDEEWQRVIAAWEAMAADPVQAAAQQAAEQAAVASERASGRRVEFQSDVRVETRGLAGAFLASNDRMRNQIAQLRTQMERRQAAIRDALAALAVRDMLPPEQFETLYHPFEPFIPRAELEAAADWQSPARPMGAAAVAQSAPAPVSASASLAGGQPDMPVGSATQKALDDLLAAGVLTEAEYRAKTAALRGSAQSDGRIQT